MTTESQSTTTKPQAAEPTDRIWCANCANQIYQSGGKWYHTSTAAPSCNVTAQAMPSLSATGVPTVDNLQRRLYEECVIANWDPEQRNTFAEEIAHLHEELSEAFRAWRRYKDCEVREVNGKLEGVPIEFADVLIGMFYNAELYGFDLLAAVERKHQFNLARNYVAEGRQLHAPAAASTVAPQQSKAHYEKAHDARYQMTHPVHPDIVVLWFLALKSHWFDDPNNMLYGQREAAKAFLYKWVETGELADDNTTLEITTAMKFREWLVSSWTVPAPSAAVQDESQPKHDLDPLEFWCDLAEVLGHPRPTKADVPGLVSEVKERLAAPTQSESSYSEGADDAARVSRVLNEVAVLSLSSLARKAAEEWFVSRGEKYPEAQPAIDELTTIIERCLSEGEALTLDDVQE